MAGDLLGAARMKRNALSLSLVTGAFVAFGGCAVSSAPPPSEKSAAAPVRDLLRPELTDAELAPLVAREKERGELALAEVEKRFAKRSPGLEFRVHDVRTSPLGDAHVLVQQVYRGVPVERRDLLVIVGPAEKLRVIGTPDRFDDVVLSPKGPLTNAERWARDRGARLSGAGERWLVPVFERRLRAGRKGTNATDYDNVITRFDAGTRIAVEADAGWSGARELFVRDDGAVLEGAKPKPAFEVATLNGYYQTSAELIKTERRPEGGYSLTDPFGNTIKTYQGQVTYAALDNAWGDGGLYSSGNPLSVDGETAAADALISLWATSTMVRHVYGMPPKPVTAYVHRPADGAWSVCPLSGGWSIELGYADSTAMFKRSLTDIEVVAHEVGHCMITDRTGTSTWYTLGEQGGLVEGSADIFGINASFYKYDALNPACTGKFCTVLRWSRTLDINNDWLFGNVLPAEKQRSFIWPKYPEWTPELSTVDGHEAGGPLRLFYYYLSVGVLSAGASPVPNNAAMPQRASEYLPEGMTGLGVDLANKIWWSTFDGMYFPSVNTYAEYRTAVLEAVSTLYGKPHTEEYKTVEDAFAAVGVGQPADRVAPTAVVNVVQKSGTEAEVTIDVGDNQKLESSEVTLTSANDSFVWTAPPCLDHCVFTVDPRSFGTSNDHKAHITATDSGGNVTSQDFSFTIDVTGPSISLVQKIANPPAYPYQIWDVTFSDTTSIKSASVRVGIVEVQSGSWSFFAPSVRTFKDVIVDQVSGGPDGLVDVVFTAADFYGNEGTKTVQLLRDNTPPESCSLSVAQLWGSATANTSFYLSGRDNGAGLRMLGIYQGSSAIATKNQTAAAGVSLDLSASKMLPPGEYTFDAICVDQYGHTKQTPPVKYTVAAKCNAMNAAGGIMTDERVIELGKQSGVVKISYQTYGVHDRILVYYQGALIKDLGCVATGDDQPPWTQSISYSGTSSEMKVRVEPSCDPTTAAPTTKWNYTISCP